VGDGPYKSCCPALHRNHSSEFEPSGLIQTPHPIQELSTPQFIHRCNTRPRPPWVLPRIRERRAPSDSYLTRLYEDDSTIQRVSESFKWIMLSIWGQSGLQSTPLNLRVDPLGGFTIHSTMMMMMMIFIYVRRVTSEAGSPETSRRVWGRAKLWNYST
jgi:hypothetical protein